MSDKFDSAIQEIAIKHGVVLSKDDPILILQTMNNRLIEDTRKAQAAMLAQFREEMEGISSQWKDDAKEKAEKVLNSALVSSKEAMSRLMQESIKETVLAMKKTISDSLAETHQLTERIQRFNWTVLVGSTTAFIGSLLLFFLTRYVN